VATASARVSIRYISLFQTLPILVMYVIVLLGVTFGFEIYACMFHAHANASVVSCLPEASVSLAPRLLEPVRHCPFNPPCFPIRCYFFRPRISHYTAYLVCIVPSTVFLRVA
jgi:hypothetical protein